MNLWRKVRAFFSPVEGWKARLVQYKRGQTAWEVPGSPGKVAVPFPVQWIPHSIDEADFDEAAHVAGFKLLSVTCCDSGKDAPLGVGVLCLRCGVPLHPEAAGMFTDMDPPVCRRCSWALLLYK